jgi:hypothetical protein
MATKDEFYNALTKLGEAATEALRQMPPEMGGRDRKLWTGLLSRLPEQIQDLKTNLADDSPRGGRSSGIIV